MRHQGETLHLNKVKELNQIQNKWIISSFIVWPFMGFLFACRNLQQPFSRNIILAFFLLYGFTIYLNPETDGQRRADKLKKVYNEPFENVFTSVDKLYEETLDFVEPFLMYSVSRISDFHGILFACYALIFGILMLSYLQTMNGHFRVNKNLNALLFFVLLIAVNPINEINGFRMWTAAWVFAVGVSRYLHVKNMVNILFAAFSLFIHFSLMPLVGIFLIYILLGNRTFIYGMLAVLSFFVSELDIEQLRSFATLLGTASEQKITAYTNEDYREIVEELESQYSWFVSLKNKGIKYFTVFSLLFIFFKNNGKFFNPLSESFYAISLLILSFANLSSLLPSGGRFFTVFYIFGFSTMLLFYVYEYPKKKLYPINYIGLPIVILFVIFAIRIFLDTASIYLFGPSLTMFLAWIDNISVGSLLF